MARGPDEREQKAYELYKSGMKLVEIASQLDLPAGTVRRWKSERKWDGDNERSENVTSVRIKEKSIKKEKNKEDIKTTNQNEELTEKQKMFCLYYVRCFNATRSYLKAYECSYTTAMVEGCKALRIPKIRDQILSLKQNRLNRELISEEDIFQKYIDIAFSDMTDFTSFGKKDIEYTDKKGNVQTANVNYVDIKDSANIDGTLVTEISEGKEGVKVKLADRMKALEWLANHMDLLTAEQRARIELYKKQTNGTDTEDEDTGVVILPPILPDTDDGVIEGGGENG